jgi:nicotinate-nucleotide adenylyltransferase
MSSPERSSGNRRLGVFGGTFNPVHTAHLALAEEVRERLRLDEVLFVPSGLPPHKGTALPPGERRLEMVRLAVRGNPFFAALDMEVKRAGRSYTVETLRELQGDSLRGRKLFFLIGMDAFREITTWREADVLPRLAHFVIFPRPGYPLENPVPYLPPAWNPETPGRSRGGITRYPLDGGKALYTVETEVFPLSATDLRRRVRTGRSIKYLVPDGVERYIKRYELYRGKTRGG